MPQAIELFNSVRPKDENIEAAIGDKEEYFYEFSTSAVNTFSENYVSSNLKHSEISNKRLIKQKRLDQVLGTLYPHGHTFDFMSIDIEGKELDALRTNDWNKFGFKYILVEIFYNSFPDLMRNELHLYLSEQGYEVCGGNINNVLYKHPSLIASS